VIIYESNYGTTEKIASYLSLILGPATYCKTSEFKEEYADFDLFVIGSPIYSGQIVPQIYEFVEKNQKWLKQKNISLFSTSISPRDGQKNLDKLEKNLDNVISKKALGGTLKIDKLNKMDSKALELFSENLGFNLGDMDHFKLEEVVEYGMELKEIKDDLSPNMPSDQLKKMVEEFLSAHNTCTLSTAGGEMVRATPIEYTYKNGFIYLLSEGGEKFANILLNKRVSIAVYEDYTGMNNLAGMQISGKAKIVPPGKTEYGEILKIKGLSPEFINKLPINLNMVKITLEKVEFLYSAFQEMGNETKQIFKFDNKSE
jgi:menaquinone-dependent protoporphyrinogen IX oxidase